MSDFKPHGYQQRGIDLVSTGRSILLAMEMGLGKTVTTLTGLQNLISKGRACNVLVVAPLRVADHTWPEEIAKWPHVNLTYSKVLGNERQRVDALKTEANIYLINYENLQWLINLVSRKPEAWPFDTVVLDESSKVKSPSTKRFKALKRIRPYAERFILLTGTPAPQGLADLWSQVYLLDGGDRLGKNFFWFRSRHYHKPFPASFTYDLNPGAEERIMSAIKDVCVSMRAEDYLKLPRFTVIPIEVDLPAVAQEVYDEMEREMIVELYNQQTIDAANAAVKTGKCLQISNGALYHEDGETWTELHNAKLDALEGIIEESGGSPVLVAYNYQHDLDRLQKRFPSGRNIKEPGAIDAWNAGKVPLLFAHPASAGHGLNLQHGGNILVWFGMSWSLELYEQFNARLHRQGQTKPVFAYHIMARGTLDYEVLDRLVNKRSVQDTLKNYLKRKAA